MLFALVIWLNLFYELFSLLLKFSLNPICFAMMWKIDTIHIFWGQYAESMSFIWAKNKIKICPKSKSTE